MYDDWKRPADPIPPRGLRLPSRFKPSTQSTLLDYMQSWWDLHPQWEYKLWDRQQIMLLLHSKYPQYLGTWDALPKDIERVDFIRCAADWA